MQFVPRDAASRTYWEPFAGAASLFFSIRPRRARVSDANEHLIECYRQVRKSPQAVIAALAAHKSNDSAEHYYRVRAQYNACAASSHTASPAQAARFIYLNRTSFNGIFRVNRSGEYNVPYGQKVRPRYPSPAEIRAAGSALQGTKLIAGDYKLVLAEAQRGDFVYLDPPYPPLNGTSFFQHYTKERFSQSDQVAVALEFRQLADRGCLVMMTNADTNTMRELYDGFDIARIHATRFVSCKRSKHRVSEIVIRNYTGDA